VKRRYEFFWYFGRLGRQVSAVQDSTTVMGTLLSKLGICVLQAIHQNRPCFRRIHIGQDNGLGSDNLIFKSRNRLQKAQ